MEPRHLLATLVVNSAADLPVDLTDSVITLRDAIEAANTDVQVAPGGVAGSGTDTISFDATVFDGVNDNSLIRLTAGVLEITDSLTIDGSSASDVTITGDSNGDDIILEGHITDVAASFGGTLGAADDLLDDNSQVLNFTTTTGNLTLSNLTLTGGRTTEDNESIPGGRENTHSGGAIRFLSSGIVTLTDSVIRGNSTEGFIANGGGIFTSGGTANLTNTTVSDNSTAGALAGGGGIFSDAGHLNLISSEVADNKSSGQGGGIRTTQGSISLTRSIVSGNRTTATAVNILPSGGGIFSLYGDVSLTESTISGNSSGRYGGGISLSVGDVNLTRSTVSGNTSGRNGGGISSSSGAITLISSTVSGNSSGQEGGGISTNSGDISLTNSTISNNAAVGPGGGLYAFNHGNDPLLTIENSIIAGNTANSGMPNDVVPDPDSAVTINHSLIGIVDNITQPILGDVGNLTGTQAAPLDPLLGPLAFFGGPTKTHVLLTDSPAIDAGFTTEAFDQRGVDRIVDLADVPNAAGSNGADIGSYEVQIGTPNPFLVTTTADVVDFTDNVVSLREAIEIANHRTGADTIEFDASVFTGGNANLIRLTSGVLEITDTLTIDGSSVSNVTITGDANDDDITDSIDITDLSATGTGLLDDNSRVLHFSSAAGDLALLGLTLTGGYTMDTPNQDAGSGILFMSGGVLTLTNSTVSGNSAAGNGGGISSIGNVTLVDSSVNDNRANGNYSSGGGIFTADGDVSLLGSTVSGNRSDGRGFDGGGGIVTSSGNVSVVSSTVSGNSARGTSSGGGGIRTSSGDVSLITSTLSGNSAGGRFGDGGGIYTRSGNVSLISSTVNRNSARESAGGIFVANTNSNPLFSVENSIVAGNTADNGLRSDLVPDFDSVLTINHSLIGVADEITQSISNGVGNLAGTAALPLDPRIGALAFNSASTKTHALLSGSPAIDAGFSTETFDQRGAARVVDLAGVTNSPNSNGSDIGSFEAPIAPPAPFVVTTNADVEDYTDSVVSLREAIGAANSVSGSQTIEFDSSVFTGGTANLIRLTAGELEITDTLIIDGAAVNQVTITSDANDDDVTDGENVTDVAASLASNDSSLDDNSRVIDFFHSTGDLTLSGVTITGGHTSGRDEEGGGIRFNSDGTLSLVQSTISGNSTTGEDADGGGIFAEGYVHLTTSKVNGNSTSGEFASGGGIFSASFRELRLLASIVSDNTTTGAEANGGGIFTSSGDVNLMTTTVAGNSSHDAGGGIATFRGDVNLSNSTVSGNSSLAAGGGIYNAAGIVNLTSSTVTGNTAIGAGGGVYVSDPGSAGNRPFTIENSIVAGNTDHNGAPNDLVPDPDSVLTINHSLIGVADNIIQTITGDVGNLTGTAAMPLDAMLGPLDDNGGPTPTHALLLGSPAIDAGDPSILLDANEFDQREAPFVRVVDGGVNGQRIDIGAVEFDDSFLLGDANQNGVVNFLDIQPFIDLLSSGTYLNEADIDRDGDVDFLDIQPFIDILASGGSAESSLALSNSVASVIASGPVVTSQPIVAESPVFSAASVISVAQPVSIALVASPVAESSLLPTVDVTFAAEAPVETRSSPVAFAPVDYRSLKADHVRLRDSQNDRPLVLRHSLVGGSERPDFVGESRAQRRSPNDSVEGSFLTAAELFDANPESLDEVFDSRLEETFTGLVE